MDILCYKVLDHPSLAIVNILGCRFHMSRLTHASWHRDILWLLSPTWCIAADSGILNGLKRARQQLPDSHCICVLANERRDKELIENISGIRAEFVSNSIFIPVNTFNIQERQKFFHAVVNAYPAKFKRTHLCAGIENLCCIRRQPEIVNFSADDMYDAAELKPRIMNHRSLTKPEVARFLNESYCGVILSEREGECRASTEYLFCGLPVVSTPSEGGRDVWYDEYNSIIVEPHEDAVRKAVEMLKSRIQSGEISAYRVRANALALRQQFIKRAEQLLADYLKTYGLSDCIRAQDVVSNWLSKIEKTTHQLEYFRNEDDAWDYINKVGKMD